MASTLTTWDAFLKERYQTDKIENLTYTDRPFLAKIPKDPNCSGDVFVEAVLHGNPQGLGATRTAASTAAAQAGSGANAIGKKFNLTYGDYNGEVHIGDKVLKASRDNAGSLLENKTAEIDGLYEAFGDTFGAYLYGNGGNAIATGTISSGVVTLASGTEDQIVNLEVGMILNASADDGSDSSHTLINASLGYVIAVNRTAGTFTVSATSGGSAGTPTSWTGTMFFFRAGDFGGTGATPIFIGLAGWIPASDPTSTTFYGVNRAVDPMRLGGVRLASADITGLNLEQRLKRLVTRMNGRGGAPTPSDIMLNPEKWQDLANALESRGQRPLEDDTARFGFMKLQLVAGGKVINIWSDRFCPPSVAWALQMKNWKMRSYLQVPHVKNGDGLQMLRRGSNTNDYVFEILAYPVVSTNAPGYNGRVATP
jgi:hypothetical protein